MLGVVKMWEPEEGSIMDPYLFSGRPKKPLPARRPTYEHTNKPMVVPVTKSLQGVTGIFKTFQKVTSAEYQLKKTNRQIKHYEAKEKLLSAREKFAERKREYDEAHPSFFKRMLEKKQKNVYTGKVGNSLPKYKEVK